MKNRTILGIICIVLAVAVTFVVAPLVNKAAAGTTNIIRMNKDISQGKMITADDITVAKVGSTGLQDNVVKDKIAVIGKYAACDIKANTNILSTYLSDTADNADDVFRTLDGTKQAISITLDSFASGVSGKLKNGDIISVIVTTDKGTAIPAELTYVKVITTTTQKGTDKDELAQNEDGTYDLPSTVTLLVNKVQSALLARYETGSKMHLSLVYRGDEETANRFLEVQEKVFTKSGGNGVVGNE